MASRKEQKEAARQRRLQEERARAERARQQRRLRMLGTAVLAAAVVIVAAIIVSSSGGGNGSAPEVNSASAKKSASTVAGLLQGIPQNGVTLGSPSAKVTVTEYGDLVCPICKDFALSSEEQLISQYVKTGKAKLVYKPLETASATANGSMFVATQTAALAAGNQQKGWNYILLFYHEQGDETTSYVTQSYLQGLAGQITGLNYSKWNSDRSSSSLAGQVSQAEQTAVQAGYNSTPTIVVSGPKGQAKPIVGDPSSFGELQSAITSVT